MIVTKKGLPEEVMFATVVSKVQWGHAGWTEDMGRAIWATVGSP